MLEEDLVHCTVSDDKCNLDLRSSSSLASLFSHEDNKYFIHMQVKTMSKSQSHSFSFRQFSQFWNSFHVKVGFQRKWIIICFASETAGSQSFLQVGHKKFFCICPCLRRNFSRLCPFEGIFWVEYKQYRWAGAKFQFRDIFGTKFQENLALWHKFILGWLPVICGYSQISVSLRVSVTRDYWIDWDESRKPNGTAPVGPKSEGKRAQSSVLAVYPVHHNLICSYHLTHRKFIWQGWGILLISNFVSYPFTISVFSWSWAICMLVSSLLVSLLCLIGLFGLSVLSWYHSCVRSVYWVGLGL